MLIQMVCAVGLVGTLLIGPEPMERVSRETHLQQFLQANSGVSISERSGRISRVYGRPFSGGATAARSAETFLANHAGMFGVGADELIAHDPGNDGAHVQPIMYDRITETYKFTGYSYTQHRDGVPVFRTALRLLVRNEPGFPLVLAAADLRDLGGFRVDAAAGDAMPANASRAAAIARAEAVAIEPGPALIDSSRKVIWAGLQGDEGVVPTLADELVMDIGEDRWLVLTDAVTGGVLYEEQQIYTVDLTGTAQGLATSGIGAEQCEAEVATALPHLVVEIFGGGAVVTDANGDFVFPDAGVDPLNVFAFLDGLWFDVQNVQGANALEGVTVTPPGPADLLFNADNTDEFARSQVNAYVHANRIRDFVLGYNPAYPGLAAVDFPVNVNRTDGFCPGNAWYTSAGGGSINFCSSQGSSPNTAYSSVIYHEYGHHLVEVAGSGQCEYGEGLGDAMSVLMLDNPNIGLGFFGSCFTALRSAAVNCQYSPTSCTTNCGSACHLCGRLLASSVWSVRNELIATHPTDYLDILSGLVVNSILLHVGTSITPDITVDLLVLDDDDASLCNGTPHSTEIIAGFAAHGLVEESFTFSLTEPLPLVIDPAGGTTVRIGVCGPVAPAADSVRLWVLAPELGGWFNIAMAEVESGVYEAAFPERDCGEAVLFFFLVTLSNGQMQYLPEDAPDNAFVTMSAASIEVALADDFETDQGWTVSGSSVTGTWERGVPISNAICDAGNPGTDGDGSGQCFLTDNDPLTCPSDVDNGTVILTSPVMDVTGGIPAVTYLQWFSNTAGIDLFEDHFTIDASNDGGATWTTIQTTGSGIFQVAGAWRRRAHRLPDFVAPTDQYRVRFTASDVGADATVEAAVDAVQVLLASCGPLTPGDIDGDGIVGITDFLALLGAWGPCGDPCPPSCAADLDGDCTVGITDFLILLGNWSPI